MKKLTYLLFLLVSIILTSCSQENLETWSIANTENSNTSWSINNTQSWFIQNNQTLSGITFTRSSFDGYKLIGNITPDVEKIEIVWENWDLKDSYFLKAFTKWSTTFTGNLKTRLKNLWIGKNEYTIRAYIGSGVVSEKTSLLDFQKTGCEVVYKRKIETDVGADKTPKLMKYEGKIRKFSIFLDGNCKGKIIAEVLGNFKLPSGISVSIMDYIDAPGMGWWAWSSKDIKSEKIINTNWIQGNILAMKEWSSDLWDTQPSDSKLIHYHIIWSVDTLRFDINTWLTKENVNKIFEELKQVLSTVEELTPETLIFDSKTVDLKNISVEWDTFVLLDKNWMKKWVKIDITRVYQGISPKEFEEECRRQCSFDSLKWNRLEWSMYTWGGSYYSAVTDITTGKIISGGFESTREN